MASGRGTPQNSSLPEPAIFPFKSQPLIALLSDFGTRDGYVACLEAVTLSRCPAARLIDITHEIPP